MDPHHKSPKISMLTCIHEDLFPEILKRLPAEAVCRFRCVCKSWNTLISSSFFVKLHQSQQSLTFSATPPILKPYLLLEDKTNQPDQYHCTTYSLRRSLKPHLLLHFPFRHLPKATYQECVTSCPHFDCLGAVRGVVCFSYKSKLPHDSIILWNPIIHKYVALPCLSSHESIQQAIGFGYDITNNDFKVVRVLNRPSFFEVYSLQQGTWKVHKVDELFYRFGGDRTGFYWNGTINWIVYTESTDSNFIPFVLTFDCTLEEFRLLDLPINHKMKFKMKLLEFRGMFSLMECNAKETRLYLWVMQVYGDARTWKRIFSSNNNYIVCQWSPNKYSKRWIELYLDCKISRLPPKLIYEAMSSVYDYEKSLFLMDDVKAISYLDDHIVLV